MAASADLEPDGIRVRNTHQDTIFAIRVAGPEEPLEEISPDGLPTFTVRAREPDPGQPWWEYDGPVEEKRGCLDLFMRAGVYARSDHRVFMEPELAEIPASATDVIAAESFSWSCEEADELRQIQAEAIEQGAFYWEERHKWQAVGEAVVGAAQAYRREPTRVVMEMEGRQVHVMVSLPPREGAEDREAPRIVEIDDWVGFARHRAHQVTDAWERGTLEYGEEELE